MTAQSTLNAWMDEACVLDWIAHVWTPYANSIEGPKLMLLDGYTGHMTSSVRRAVNPTNAELKFIPPGHTSKSQLMDVGLNKPFKDRLQHEVERYLTANPLGEHPTRPVVSHWIVIDRAWDGIASQMTINAWHHIGFVEDNLPPNPNPNPDVVEDNDDHDPLALNEGNTECSPDDDNCNSVKESLGL